MSFLSTNNHSIIQSQDELIITTTEKKRNDSISNNKIPRKLKKTFYCTLSLFGIGFLLLIVAIEEMIRKSDFNEGLSFLVLSVLVLIPGIYYLFQFYKAKRAKDIDEKAEIFNSIPEI